jgi:hypothetical protein
MKFAIVFDEAGSTPLRDDEGKLRVFPVYKWYVHVTNGEGRWESHFLAYLSACTENFKWQQYQGIFAVGRSNRGLWAEFTIGSRTFHLGAQHA